MANMSYCRFENTYNDLNDCYYNMTDPLKVESEREYRQRLVELCATILSECCEGVTLDWDSNKISVKEYDDEDEE